MNTPDPRDIAAVIANVRRDGSVMWPLAALPPDFPGWRRRVRAAAREAALRISVRRVNEIAFVEHLDHVVTDDQYGAFGKIVEAQLDGRPISWDRALHDAARERMMAVPGETVAIRGSNLLHDQPHDPAEPDEAHIAAKLDHARRGISGGRAAGPQRTSGSEPTRSDPS